MQAFIAAEKMYEGKSGKVGGDEGGARYYYGLATFAEAAVEFEKSLDIHFPANSSAAAARIGQISQDFSDQLFTAEIPKEVRATQMIDGYDLAQDKVDAYCDALPPAAAPLAQKSLEAFGACLSKSTELGWFSDWSKLCERELGQIKPEEFPTASELRGDSDQVAPVIAVEPPTKVD